MSLDNLKKNNNHIIYLESILKPLLPYFDTVGEFGDWESGQGEAISWYEMFARSTYGIISYTAVMGNNEFVDAYNKALLKIIVDSRYTTFVDGDQKAVEMIPLVVMLYLHRKYTWDTYSKENQQRILAYFGNINKIAIGTDNWQFFRIVVSSVLNSLGGNEDLKYIEDSWLEVDRCYCGDGWYRDGINGPKDYYVAFGYHFYSLLLCYLFPDNIERNVIIKDRAKLFADEYKYLFDADGRMIVYGRSMIYRFATLSFWSMYLLNGLGGDDSGYIESLIEKGINWWKSQHLFDRNGLLNLGVAYRNENICEFYNSAGSPYWVLKAFFFLMYERKTETVSTIDDEEEVRSIANGDMIIVKKREWSTAYINSYSGVGYVSNNSAKYMRFAYNSATGFNVSKNPCEFWRLSDDNSLVFNIGGVKHLREANICYKNFDQYQEFLWHCGNLIKVRSVVVPLRNGYIRIHVVESRISTNCIESGFAISSTTSTLNSRMICLSKNGKVAYKHNEVNSNIYFPHTIMPSVEYRIGRGYNLLADYTCLYQYPNAEDNVTFEWHLGTIQLSVEGMSLHLKLNPLQILSICLNYMQSRLRNFAISVYNGNSALKNVYRRIKGRR